MKHTAIYTLAFMLLSFHSTAFAQGNTVAQGGLTIISKQHGTGEVTINDRAFRALSMAIRNLYDLGDDELAENAKRQGWKSKDGRPMIAFAASKEGDVIITTPQEVELKIVKIIPPHKVVISAIKDGKPIKLDGHDVSVRHIDGRDKPYKIQNLEDSGVKLRFVLAIDRSGSMVRHMPAVEKAAQEFMAGLAKNAECFVLSFANDIKAHTKKFLPCRRVSRAVRGFTADGGTDLVGALEKAYGSFPSDNDESFDGVFLISDGLGNSGKPLSSIVKKGPLFAYWFGDSTERKEIEKIVDAVVQNTKNTSALMQKFFKTATQNYSNLQVITTKPQ